MVSVVYINKRDDKEKYIKYGIYSRSAYLEFIINSLIRTLFERLIEMWL
jgi:hypothetical protein